VSGAREGVLARIRDALADRPAVLEVPAGYATGSDLTRNALVSLFRAHVEDAGGIVLEGTDVRATVAAALADQHASRVVVAPDLPAELRPVGVELVEDHGLASGELDVLDAALTTCASACADTGTIALAGGPGQGRRAITLLPDLHVCVVERGQIVGTVPELFSRLEPSARDGRPIVLVSGPSATSDIGFERVEGVHGPRRLVVVLSG
jgi:L-lactate dehydrogenase complex protein LldG